MRTSIFHERDPRGPSVVRTNEQDQEECITIKNGCTTAEEACVEANERLNLTESERAQNEEFARICQDMDNGDMY